MFGRRHRIRRVAAQVLFAWLFTLTMGIVHACVLPPGWHPGLPSAVHDEHLSAMGHDMPGMPGGDNGHHSPHGDNAACAKACNEPSTGAQTLKQKIDPFTAIWLTPAPADAQIGVATAAVAATLVADPDPGPTAVPIRIAFLRLTL